MKKIDILMATYNGERFLKEQIKSILSQTYKNFNLIISDDASTDKTYEILKYYEQKDKRVKIFKQDKNIGIASNFEFLLNKVESEFFMFADQDDIWEIDKVEISYDKLEADEADLVYSDLMIVDESLNIIEKSYWRKKGFINKIKKYNNFQSLYLNNYITGSTILCKSKFIDKILPLPKSTQYIIHDYWVSLVVSHNGRLTYIDKPLIKYRQHTKNQIGSKTKSKEISNFEELRNLFINVKIEHFQCFIENDRIFDKNEKNLNLKSLEYFKILQKKKYVNLRYWNLFIKLYKYETFIYRIENFIILNLPCIARILFKLKGKNNGK